MVWTRRFEGDVQKVVGEAEAAVASALSKAEAKAHTVVADVAKELQAIVGEGKKLVLKIESNGHFNDDGTGNVQIGVVSEPAPVAAESPQQAPASAPVGAPAAPAGGEQKAG